MPKVIKASDKRINYNENRHYECCRTCGNCNIDYDDIYECLLAWELMYNLEKKKKKYYVWVDPLAICDKYKMRSVNVD